MSVELSRRHFLRGAAFGAAVVLTKSGWSIARAGSAGKGDADYSFVVLGDLHYDLWSHHDMAWVEKEKPRDIRQIKGYVESTETYMPMLFERVREAITQASTPVPMVVQIGDLVEGLCGSYDLQALQFRDAMKFIDQAKLGSPMLVTKGNHDITGPGAKEAFNDVLLPWIGKQAGQTLQSANYVVRQGEDAFVFFDAYERNMPWLKHTLESLDARHIFFVTHPPVVPYNARAHWGVFGKPHETVERKALLDLLGRHHAIVLGGHLHKYSMLTRQTDGGGLVQLAVNSVLRSVDPSPRHVLSGAEVYNEKLLEMEPRFSPDSLADRKAILNTEQPAISRFAYADFPGFAMVHVSREAVEVEMFVGLEKSAWQRNELTDRTVRR